MAQPTEAGDDMSDDDAVFEVTRKSVQAGRTLSEEALEKLSREMMLFIGTRMMARWDETGEPPTALRVEMTVSVQ